MKKIISLLIAVCIIIAGCCSCTPATKKNDKHLLVASFYPVYIFTLNLVEGIEDFSVESMARQSVGCLHDYSLTARDVKLLQDASLFIINGAGMEGFIDELFKSVDSLKTVDSSEGIELLCSEHEDEKHHHGENHDHNHSENSHIWLSVENAKKQVENIKNGIVGAFPEYEREINDNFKAYIKRLDSLSEKRNAFSESVRGAKVISFHGAYEYLALECGFEIIETIETDEGGEPSAKALGELCEKIKAEGITSLFTEPHYSGSAAGILSREADIKIYVLNPVISGDDSLTAYEDIMNENYETILKAVK